MRAMRERSYRRMIKIAIFFCMIALISISGFPYSLYAEPEWKQFELMSGYGIAHLPAEVEKHKIIPLVGRFYCEVKPDGFFGADIFYTSVLEPASKMEAGGGIFWQQRYRAYSKISPYWEAEGGLIYTTLDTKEQTTNENLLLQLGFGTYISLKDNLQFDAGYRLRHYSNAGIKLPNIGINHHMLVFGLCWNF